MKRNFKRIFRSQAAPVVVVFLAASFIVWWSWRSAIAVREQAKQTARNERIVENSNAIKERLQDYEGTLAGLSGLVKSSAPITVDKWRSYIQTTDAVKNNPGALSFGYAVLATADQLPGIVESQKAAGITDFAVNPEGFRELYSIIMYLEPQPPAGRKILGFDMLSEDTRRQAQERAADGDGAVLSGLLKILRDNSTVAEPGYQLFFPIYRDNSSAKSLDSAMGFTFIRFTAADFFNGIETEQKNGDYGIQVSDKSESAPTVVFTSHEYGEVKGRADTTTTVVPVRQKDSNWEVEFVFDESSLISGTEQSRPSFIAIIGVVGAVLTTLIVWLLLRARTYDLTVQKEHEVNSAKDSLLSIASHQLRTPATGVKQYLGIVLQGFTGDITPSQEAMLEKAYASNERQLRTINEVLHLAKLESGRIVLAKSEVDLSKLIQDVVLEVGSEVVERNHSLRTSGLNRPVVVQADEHMLRMAIENLVTNAIKYTPNGGRIWVRLKPSRYFVDIEVKDNGIGVAVEDRSKLYKQFVRLHNKLSRQVSGTGIGLYLAKQLVELHGGQITLQSAPNKGSTFTITLPKGKRRK